MDAGEACLARWEGTWSTCCWWIVLQDSGLVTNTDVSCLQFKTGSWVESMTEKVSHYFYLMKPNSLKATCHKKLRQWPYLEEIFLFLAAAGIHKDSKEWLLLFAALSTILATGIGCWQFENETETGTLIWETRSLIWDSPVRGKIVFSDIRQVASNHKNKAKRSAKQRGRKLWILLASVYCGFLQADLRSVFHCAGP